MSRPFKGRFYYEWQIGPFVFQWGHEGAAEYGLRRWSVFRDPYWRA